MNLLLMKKHSHKDQTEKFIHRVLTTGTHSQVDTFLKNNLPTRRFVVIDTLSGQPFVEAARKFRPNIVLFGNADATQETVRMEIAVLKEIVPQAKILVLSGESTRADAVLVEPGVFYYGTGVSDSNLLRIIQAAAQDFLRRKFGRSNFENKGDLS